nr:hypothetical protein [Spongiactinospora gelatinilytica]
MTTLPAATGRTRKAQRQQRGGGLRLPEYEPGQQDGREQEQRPAPGRRAGVDDHIDQQHRPRDDQDRAQDIDAGPQALAAVTLDDHERRRHHHDPDEDVDQQGPVPAQPLGEHAPGQHADRGARALHEAEHPEGPALFALLREQRHDHAEHDRRGRRRARALYGPEGDQHGLVHGEPAQQRRDREHAQPDDEHPALADQVAEPSGDQQQAAERHQMGVHHPGQVRCGEAQVGLDRGQRDDHDRPVERQHEHRRADHDEREPARPARYPRPL